MLFRMLLTYTYPAKIFNIVDFPAPDGPIMAVSSPDRNAPDIPCRISLRSVIMKNTRIL